MKKKKKKKKKKKNNVHIFARRAVPAIQCARRFFYSYLKETKKNQQPVLK